jgi:2'-hydroxyisoflavone reductase
LKILVLGGTSFVGRHISETLLTRGHELTIFNRWKTNPDLFVDVDRRVGDRDGGLDTLRTGEWDAVIDVNGYVPRLVRDSASLLQPRVGRYVFISTISVYAHYNRPPIMEDHLLGELEEETEDVTGETYGPLKVECEAVVRERYPDNHSILRPNLIVGPHDPTDRFTYWPVRIRRGGNVLCPGNPDSPVQFIDVRDLATFAVHVTENDLTGIWNTVGPEPPVTFSGLIDACRSDTPCTPVWADDAFLLRRGLKPFMDLPLWIPNDLLKEGFHRISNRSARDAGLTLRPIADTVRDTLSWADSLGKRQPLAAGLTVEQENDLLARWASRVS